MTYFIKSRFPGETSTLSDMQMICSNVRKRRGTIEPLDEGNREE